MSISRALLIAIAATAMSLQASAATTYYVSPTGSNGDPGSSSNPWQTLQFAADSVAAGDTVIVRPGTYAGFNVKTSGLAGQPTVFSAQPGALVNTAAAAYNGTNHHSRINIDSVSHIVIQGFEIVGTANQADSKEGIRVVGPEDGGYGDIAILNNHVHHNGDRNILTGFVGNLRIENNVVHHAYDEHGIYVSNSADNHVIRGNVSYSNRGAGIQVNADASLGGDGIITGVRIENNTIYDNGAGGGSAINLDGVQSSVIQNNLLYGNHASGISLFREDGAQPSSGNIVANNTIINAADARWALNIQNGSSGNTVLNNILFSLQFARGAIDIDAGSLANFVSDYNILEDRLSLDGSFIGIAQWRVQTGDDAHSFTVTLGELEALFADYAANDFQLDAGGAAVDAGTGSLLNGSAKLAPLYDLLLALRPAGAGFDIGAYEAQPVPEPGTWVLLVAGLGLMAAMRRRR